MNNIREDVRKTIRDNATKYEDGAMVIAHRVIETIAMECGLVVQNIEMICGKEDFAVYKCTVEDPVTGLTNTQLGESNNKNLETDISKKYPHIMAYKRAYDRAVLRVLGIFDIYSDEEIEKKGNGSKAETAGKPDGIDVTAILGKDAVPVTGPEEPEKRAASTRKSAPAQKPAPALKSEPTTKSAPTPKSQSDMTAITGSNNIDINDFIAPMNEDDDEINREIAFDEPVTETEAETKPKAEAEASEKEPDYLNSRVKIGKYKETGITFKQLYEQHPDGFEWVLRFASTKGTALFSEQGQIAVKVKEFMEKKAG